MLRALDLFCGACGGWSVGLHANGIETVAACEIEPWRRERFARNFPKARMYDDVRSLTADRLVSDLGYLPDIIVGSPPCQDASLANAKGKGVDGERTGLFFEAVRLVSEVRPVWACFENVPGLRARGYDRVHDELEALGYEVRPLVVGAWHAGAPHRRNRVWIVAVANEGGQRAGFSDLHARQSNTARGPIDNAHPTLLHRPSIARDQSDGPDARDVADAATDRLGARGEPRASWEGRQPSLHVEHASDASSADATGRSADGGRSGWQSSLAAWEDWNGGPPDLGRVDDGLPKGMARKSLSAFGDAVVPQITAAVIRSILKAAA